MYSKNRDNLKNEIKNAGGTTSAYDSNVQYLKGVKITHSAGNVTTFDNKKCFGASSASDTVKKIK